MAHAEPTTNEAQAVLRCCDLISRQQELCCSTHR